jgi:hypothetical protein
MPNTNRKIELETPEQKTRRNAAKHKAEYEEVAARANASNYGFTISADGYFACCRHCRQRFAFLPGPDLTEKMYYHYLSHR